MKMENHGTKSCVLCYLMFVCALFVAMVGTGSAKSLYVNRDIQANSPIRAYDIQPSPSYLVYQMDSSPTRYGGAGLAIDTDSEILFVTFEFSGTLDIVDADTMAILGQVTAPGASNLAGIVVDQEKQKVYAVDRQTSKLYVYSWDATAKTLALDGIQYLPGVSAFGLALDESNDLLYVTSNTTTINIFNTVDWSSSGTISTARRAIGIAVDVKSGFVYSGGGWDYNYYLSRYSLDTSTESQVYLGSGVGAMGIAVDPATSLVYVSTGYSKDNILVYDSSLNFLFQTGDIGNPTGIAIPGTQVSYNPLNLAKNDIIVGTGVSIGSTFTYEIACDNVDNEEAATNVKIVDNLPLQLDFVEATHDGEYNSTDHEVSWDIGDIPAGMIGPLIKLTVRVNDKAVPGSTIYNSCTIDSENTPPTTVIDQDPDDPDDEPGTNISNQWSFAIITDLHIGDLAGASVCLSSELCVPIYDYAVEGWNDGKSGAMDHTAAHYLQETVDLVNICKDKYNIEFVAVLGDMTDSAELSELILAREILDGLQVPWIPIIGNHDAWPQAWLNPLDPGSWAPASDSSDEGPDKYFHDVFGDKYSSFSEDSFCEDPRIKDNLSNWEDPYAIWNSSFLWPIPARWNYFENFAFDYKGYHFVGLDFNRRDFRPGWLVLLEVYFKLPAIPLPGNPADADLHDPYGTWPWFTEHLTSYVGSDKDTGSGENIILLAHHPFRSFRAKKWGAKTPFQMGFSDFGLLPYVDDTELDTVKSFLKDYNDRVWRQFAGHSHETGNRILEHKKTEILNIVETEATKEHPMARVVQFQQGVIVDGINKNYAKLLPEGGLQISTTCPVDLEITDPDGLVVSKTMSEIAHSIYSEQDSDQDGSPEDSVYIRERKLGDYQIRVIPEPEANPGDTYILEVSMCEDTMGWVSIVLAQDVPIAQVPSEPYTFTVKEREVTQLVYSGDLQSNNMAPVHLSATLTDGDGGPLTNQKIVFEIGTQSTTAITGIDGVATASLNLNQGSGSYYVDVTYAGSEDYLPAVASETFEITNTAVDEYVGVNMGRLGYDRRTRQFSVGVTVTNTSAEVIGSPVQLVIESISSPSVTVANPDGTTPDGKPFLDLTPLLGDDQLAPGESVATRLYFNNPTRRRFSFDTSVRGVLLD